MKSTPRVQESTRGGFTLIELMVVISIILVLISALSLAGVKLRKRAFMHKTQSVMEQVKLALADYEDMYGNFPPDGLSDDRPVECEETGESLYGGAALAYQLTAKLKLRRQQPDGSFKETLKDALMDRGDSAFVFVPPDQKETVEIVDGWGQPLHYDRVKDEDEYSMQDDWSTHLEDAENWDSSGFHPEDPREDIDNVSEIGPQNIGKYDLWSLGPDGHSGDPDPDPFVYGNWRGPSEELEE